MLTDLLAAQGIRTVRDTTRHAWETLRTPHALPSVRAIHSQVGGNYNVVASECRTLRLEAGPARQEALAAAWQTVREELQHRGRFYQEVRLWAERLQGHRRGPLTDLVDLLAEAEA
jgi:hypothetical protein